MADNEQASEPTENIKDSAITAGEEHAAEENNAEQHLVDEETAVNENNTPGDSGGGGEEAKEEAPAEAPADDQNAGGEWNLIDKLNVTFNIVYLSDLI